MSAGNGGQRDGAVRFALWAPVVVAVVQVPVLVFDSWRLFVVGGDTANIVAQCAFSCFLLVRCGMLFAKNQARGNDDVFPRLPQFFLDSPLFTGLALAGLVLGLSMVFGGTL